MYTENTCSELLSQLMSDINCRVWIDSDTIHSLQLHSFSHHPADGHSTAFVRLFKKNYISD
jgi:hypothetical protein